eukprot:1159183-Pelagomonas_calceolata.AAC.27
MKQRLPHVKQCTGRGSPKDEQLLTRTSVLRRAGYLLQQLQLRRTAEEVGLGAADQGVLHWSWLTAASAEQA